jgi:L-ascorbate metabolism protein UlaG (beta-lactamase superfamily)
VKASIEWLGCTTFRLKVRGLTLFFDAYLDGDRAPSAARVGLSAKEVTEAQFVFVSHAHFDHMLGADTLAERTGATVVGSYEVARILSETGVPEAQILPVSGGEPVDCGQGVRVTALPAIHSCLFAEGSKHSGTECTGGLGVSAQQRDVKAKELFSYMPLIGDDVAVWDRATSHRRSSRDGGQLAYLVDTPDGAIFVSSSAGCWTGIIRDQRPDVAVIAASGRPNVNGEPFQGSLAQFILREVELMRPKSVIFSHHDALMPPLLTETDTAEAEAILNRDASYASLVSLLYSEAVPILG